jgi:hypothetical protein
MNDDFAKAFESFCTYILKYANNFTMFTSMTLGGYKRYSKFHYDKFVEVCAEEITKTNFHSSMVVLFAHYNQVIKTKPPSQLFDLVNACIENKLSCSVSVSTEFKYVLDDINMLSSFLDIWTVLPEEGQLSLVANLNNQMELLKQQLSNSNNNASSPASNNNNNNKTSNMPNSFNNAYNLFKNDYTTILKNENHIRLFQSHLDNGTCPSNLMWQNFPEPFLPTDVSYIEGYNKLISNFQIEAMKFSQECCAKKIDVSSSKIVKLIEHYNDEPDIENKSAAIKSEISDKLKKDFDNKHSSITKLTPRLLLVKTFQDTLNVPTTTNSNNNNNKNRNRSPSRNNRGRNKSRSSNQNNNSSNNNSKNSNRNTNNSDNSYNGNNYNNNNDRNKSMSRGNDRNNSGNNNNKPDTRNHRQNNLNKSTSNRSYNNNDNNKSSNNVDFRRHHSSSDDN